MINALKWGLVLGHFIFPYVIYFRAGWDLFELDSFMLVVAYSIVVALAVEGLIFDEIFDASNRD